MNDFLLRGLCVVFANLLVASVASSDLIPVEKSVKHRQVEDRSLLANAGDLWSLPEPSVFQCEGDPSFVMRFDVSVSTQHHQMDMYHPTSRSLFVCFFILTAGFHLCFRITLSRKCLRGICFGMM
jgi:hypothetical protein